MDNPRYAFFEGKIVPIGQAKVDIRTNSLQYGTAVFEGLRSYWNPQAGKSYIFRMAEHYKRFAESAKILMIDLKYDIDELSGITIELLRKEEYREDSYIRPFAYNSGLHIGPKLVGNPQDIFIYSIPLGDYLDISKPINVCTSSWTRINDNSIPPRAKISGSYVNAALQKTEALLNGYDEAIVLTSDGQHVSEGSAMNIFMVKGDTIVTPPIADDILEGITRNSIIEIASNEMDIEVIERSMDRTELYTAHELFFCGTGAQISPIGTVDKRTVGEGKLGMITKRLQEIYFKIVKNNVEKYSSWCTEV